MQEFHISQQTLWAVEVPVGQSWAPYEVACSKNCQRLREFTCGLRLSILDHTGSPENAQMSTAGWDLLFM